MSYSSVAVSPSVRPSLIARLAARLRLHLALVAAAATLAVVWAGLVLTHEPPHLAVPAPVALRRVLANSGTAQMLSTVHWDRWEATAMDSRYEVLGFYRGPRIVATVTVGFDGHVVILDSTDLARQKYEYGSNVANDARVLAILCVLFVLVSAVWPLWRIRNLDVLVVASLTLSVVLYNRGMLTRMALVSYPALTYIALRCSWWALGSRRRPPPSVPLYDYLTRRWTEAQRVRMLRFLALTAALVVTIVGLTSFNVIDVGYAVMEGATLIIHGVLPYGHIPDVLHGDTYPIGSYLFYVPAAWLSPVHNVWDDADVTLAVAVVCALAAAVGLWRLASRAGPTPERADEASAAGLRSAIAWLTFPPLIVTISTGTSDVALAAMLVGALLLWRRPGWSAAAVSGAAWFKLTPLAILPLLLARLRGRALVRAVAAIALTSAVMVAFLVALGGAGAPLRMLSAMTFQFTRGSQHNLWAVIGSVPLQQLAEAATVALIVGVVVRMRRDRALAEDRARLAGVAAAILIGLQISANYWSYLYLVWAFPFIAVSLFAATV